MDMLSELLALKGNPPVTGGSPYKGPAMRAIPIHNDAELRRVEALEQMVELPKMRYVRRVDAHETPL